MNTLPRPSLVRVNSGLVDLPPRLTLADMLKPSPGRTIRYARPKTRRNAPCGCHSGKKYKHCHGK